MIRIVLFSLMFVHSLMHIRGFLKEPGYGMAKALDGNELIVLTGNLSKAGVLWLIRAIAFIAAAVLYIARKGWYWIPVLAALVISQTLIVIYWNDVKFGTVANGVIALLVILGAAKVRFNEKYVVISDRLTRNAAVESILIADEHLQKLPKNVQRWVRRSNVVGKSSPNIIQVFQRGTMRMKPDRPWMPFTAVERFTIDPPSFVWGANIRAFGFMTIAGRDKYEAGQGNMVIKPAYLFTIADAVGPEIDQGTLLRYLGEMAWFPHAAISSYLRWEEIDPQHAKVTMTYGGVTASGIFTFNDEGLVKQFEAQRYGDFDGVYRMEKWVVAVTNYKLIGGTVIGNENEVTRKLKDGDFLWMKMEVTDIQSVVK